MEPQKVTYIIKLLADCNLGCRYCYYFQSHSRCPTSRLDSVLVSRLIREASIQGDTVSLIWHGGEPLLVGVETFRDILKLQAAITLETGTHFTNHIQTNACLLTSEWLDILRQGKFGIGVSLDGPEWLHDFHRVDPDGKGSHARVMRGIHLLQEASINFAVIAVVSQQSLGHEMEIYRFFLENDIRSFDFLPLAEMNPDTPRDRHLTQDSLERGGFAGFMNRVFDLWFEEDDPSVHIRYLENVLVGLMGGRPGLCKLNRSCGTYITLDHDGRIGPCDNLFGSNHWAFGNLANQELKDILAAETRNTFQVVMAAQRSECARCPYYTACGGGCTKYTYMLNRDCRNSNYFCADMRQIFAHVSDTLHKQHPALPTIA